MATSFLYLKEIKMTMSVMMAVLVTIEVWYDNVDNVINDACDNNDF